MDLDTSVRTLPWLPVVDTAGRRRQVGLDAALADAHELAAVDLAEPLERYAVLRFLCTAIALVMREEQAPAAALAERGLSRQAIDAALDPLGGKLDLVGEDPFCQEPALADAAKPNATAASLMPGYPGPTTKAWFTTAPGHRGFAPGTDGSIAVEEAPLVLLTHQLASPRTNASLNFKDAHGFDGEGPAKAPVGGSLLGGAAKRAGIRALWLGDTLLETLLMNTPVDWVASRSLPAWAVTPQDASYGITDPLEAAFVSGTDQLLAAPRADGRFQDAYRGLAYRLLHTGRPASGGDDSARSWFSKSSLPEKKDQPPAQLFLAGQFDPHAVWQEPKSAEHAAPHGLRVPVPGISDVSVFADLARLYSAGSRPSAAGPAMLLAAPEGCRSAMLITAVSGMHQTQVTRASWVERQPTTLLRQEPVAVAALEPFAAFMGEVRSAVRRSCKAFSGDLAIQLTDTVCQRVSDDLLDPSIGLLEQVLERADGGEPLTTRQAARIRHLTAAAFRETVSPMCSHRQLANAARIFRILDATLAKLVRQLHGTDHPDTETKEQLS